MPEHKVFEGRGTSPNEGLEDAIEMRRLLRTSIDAEISDSVHNEEVEEVDDEKIQSRRTRERRESFTLYTPDEERAVTRKLDRRLVLFVALLYMLSFLDRSNIGNARVAGMNVDLQLDSAQYEWLLTAFYMTYIIFEWMTLLYRVLPPHVYISLCVFSWGLIASLQAVAGSFFWMCLLRALLGVAEAAFGPGVPFYLSFFFKREELALRTGLFISAAPLATSFASSLAWAITKAGEHSSFATWRLLLLIEGFPSIIVAAVAWFQIPDSPDTAAFLTNRQKKVARLRLRHERRSKDSTVSSGLKWKEIGRTLIDPKCYLTAMMFFSSNVAFSSLPPFLPTIINEMEYSPLASQALSAPPYLVAFLLVLLVAHQSDRHKTRSVYIILVAMVGAFGYALLAIAGAWRLSSAVRYSAVFPAASGFFCAVTLIITWTINNQASDEGRGTGLAMLNVLGQLGPLVGTRLYPDEDKPYYVKGMAVCAGFMIAVAVLAWVLRVALRRENRKAMSMGSQGRVTDQEYVKVGSSRAEDSEIPGEDEDGPNGDGIAQDAIDRQFVYFL